MFCAAKTAPVTESVLTMNVGVIQAGKGLIVKSKFAQITAATMVDATTPNFLSLLIPDFQRGVSA